MCPSKPCPANLSESAEMLFFLGALQDPSGTPRALLGPFKIIVHSLPSLAPTSMSCWKVGKVLFFIHAQLSTWYPVSAVSDGEKDLMQGRKEGVRKPGFERVSGPDGWKTSSSSSDFPGPLLPHLRKTLLLILRGLPALMFCGPQSSLLLPVSPTHPTPCPVHFSVKLSPLCLLPSRPHILSCCPSILEKKRNSPSSHTSASWCTQLQLRWFKTHPGSTLAGSGVDRPFAAQTQRK